MLSKRNSLSRRNMISYWREYNPVLGFIGSISLEVYLIHDFFLEFYQSKFVFLSKEVVYVYAVIGSAIAVAVILWFIISKLNVCFLRRKRRGIKFLQSSMGVKDVL